jgi:hypothetical protein
MQQWMQERVSVLGDTNTSRLLPALQMYGVKLDILSDRHQTNHTATNQHHFHPRVVNLTNPLPVLLVFIHIILSLLTSVETKTTKQMYF